MAKRTVSEKKVDDIKGFMRLSSKVEKKLERFLKLKNSMV